MRILHVTREHGTDRRYGIGRSLGPVLAALEARGHTVRYLTQDEQSERGKAWQREWTARLGAWGLRLAGPPGQVLSAVWLERLNMARLAAKVARDWQADVVHLHDPWMAWGYRWARRFVPGATARWGLTEHGFGCYSDATGEEGVPYSPRLLQRHRHIEAGVLAQAAFVVCPTHAARAQLARDLALPELPPHWHAVPHAAPQLSPWPDRGAARQHLGWSEAPWQLLAVGRINPVKRFDLLLKAVIEATRQRQALGQSRPLRLTLLGEGDAAPLQQLLQQAGPLPLQLHVQAVADVSPYLHAADVYLGTARNESFGLANLEALAAGLPALCAAAGGVPEVTGGAAWLLPSPSDSLVPALTRGLLDLLEQPALRESLAAAGRRHAAAWPDAMAVAGRYEEIYRGLC